MGLNSDKTSKVFFVLIFAVFLPDFIFLYHSGTVIQVSSKLWNVNVFDLYTSQNQNVHCVVSSNDQYQGNGFAADVLLGRDHQKVVPIGPIVRGVIAFPILGCDHPSCVPVGPLAGELWHFEYFLTTTVRHFEF